MSNFRNALVSVSDKSGLLDFLKPLAKSGTRLVSTGGTSRTLKEGGLTVTDVSTQTEFPEVMDGRVKTLHPRIHMALLARLGNAGDDQLLLQSKLEAFDLVVVNLYPFEQTLAARPRFEDLIENIDIGGPTLLRAAAKNFERITVIVDPDDYKRLADAGEITLDERRRLAAKAFAHVSTYDAMIAHTLAPRASEVHFPLGGSLQQKLRYGENPHQKAAWYRRRGSNSGWQDARILQGKELSYNNLLDLDSALGLLRDFDGPSAVAVKHNNPCGAATDANAHRALDKALAADPVSVFGGIVAVNFELDQAAAERLSTIFLECVVAPRVSDEARSIFAKKKNLRILEWTDLGLRDDFPRVQTIQGGFLVQQPDQTHLWNPSWKITGETPSPLVRADLSFAWGVAAHLKSNAIAIAKGKQTLGLGMGQVNRVDAVDQAIARAQSFHPEVKGDLVLASDAFFPFADSIVKAHAGGVRWIIQPGGSLRDDEVLAKAKELGINMVLTGERHFRH